MEVKERLAASPRFHLHHDRRHEQVCRELVRFYFLRIDSLGSAGAPLADVVASVDVNVFARLELMAKDVMTDLVSDREASTNFGVLRCDADMRPMERAHEESGDIGPKVLSQNLKVETRSDRLYVDR